MEKFCVFVSTALFIVSLVVFCSGMHYLSHAETSIHQIYGMLHFVSGDILLLGAVIGLYLFNLPKKND